MQGLFPTAWSANGNRILAEFEGQDTSYAVMVIPDRRAAAGGKDGNGEQGLDGTAISKDGRPCSASPVASNRAPTIPPWR